MLCSTSVCPHPGPVLDCWQELCRELAPDGVALDPRLDHDQQGELLEHAARRGIPCPQLAHPLVGPSGLRSAWPASPDRDERRAAGQQLQLSAERAHRFGVSRVVLLPGRLPLSLSPARLAAELERGASPAAPVERLDQERAAHAPRSFDALCLVLDPVLSLFDRLDAELVLPLPAPWPDQLPDAGEVERLGELFAGAPLAVAIAADWWHVAERLGRAPRQLPRASALFLADACGLTTMLPPGTGELDWAGLGRSLQGGPVSVVLRCSADRKATRGELAGARGVLRLLWGATPG